MSDLFFSPCSIIFIKYELDAVQKVYMGIDLCLLPAKKVRVGHPLDEDEAAHLLKSGPFVYELFSVMVHQGNAAGGHYYAFIKWDFRISEI